MEVKLGDLLVKEGLITQDQLEKALEHQRTMRVSMRSELARLILDDGVFSLKDLARIAQTVGYEAKLLTRLAEQRRLTKDMYREIRAQKKNLVLEELVNRKIVSVEDLVTRYFFIDAIEEAEQRGLLPHSAQKIGHALAKNKLLGQVLVSLGYIQPSELNYILDSAQKRKRIGDMLVDAGYITPNRLRTLLKQRGRSTTLFGEFLVNAGAITEEQLLEVLSTQHHLPFIKRQSIIVTPGEKEKLRTIITPSYAKRHRVMPVQLDGTDLTVAIRDPRILKDLTQAAFGQFNVSYALMLKAEFRELFKELYGEELDDDKDELIQTAHKEHFSLDLAEDSDDAFCVDHAAALQDMEAHELVNRIIAEALESGASDIHIEQDYEGVKLRFRVDGVLIQPSEEWMRRKLREKISGVISRIKIMSDLDIAERRLPQDGAFRMTYMDRREKKKANMDFRVATCKAAAGENVVIRILDSRKAGRSLDEIDFGPEIMTKFKAALANPAGMILVTGPTGSGKSTTLYAALQHVHNPGIKIITAEDPVEYNFPGIMQTQIQPKIGLDFPRLLRSFLRLDPDVILVGEIRDRDTARIAFDAAQTGHLLLSTLHTNDSIGSIVRLRDLEVEAGQIAESVKAVLAQRLVRLVCPHCSQEYEPDEEEWSMLFIDYPKGLTFRRGEGCDQCHFTGYKGRACIAEILVVDHALQSLIARRNDMDEIRRAPILQGMRTMVEHAVSKIPATSLPEIVRVTPGDLIDQFKRKQKVMGLHSVLPERKEDETAPMRNFMAASQRS